MKAYSSAVMRGFTGTATAPSLTAPQKTAGKRGVSSSTSRTRCSISTPRLARALPARFTLSATSAQVIVRPS
jgi:hypothetical protein